VPGGDQAEIAAEALQDEGSVAVQLAELVLFLGEGKVTSGCDSTVA
jgi:hypothetical protein